MKVILVRHAKSAYDWNRWPRDSLRHLSDKGRERQNKVALGMKKENITFDEVWVSPYTRAKQTLDIIMNTYETSVPVRIKSELTPGGDPEAIFYELQEESKKHPEKTILLVGHNPNMSDLLQLISNLSYQDMRTSDVAICSLTGEDSKLIKYYHRKELYP